MYSRISIISKQSFFLFGPRGTGKSTYLKTHYPKAPYIDLLDDEIYTNLLSEPKKLSHYIPEPYSDFIIIDEIQKLPRLLDEVHRLIEIKKYKFILTGSSARKLKRSGINLLGGRALIYHMYPLTIAELGNDFKLEHSLNFGQLPMAYTLPNPQKYLQSYIRIYLEEEIKQEGYSRNLGAFARFLQAASLSQASVLNMAKVASECSVERKVVENYFSILDDLLLAYQVPVFTKKAKRRMIQHRKFYFFDVGVYQTIRPKGPLDTPENLQGAALETLVLQELKAINSQYDLGYEIFYWHTSHHLEIDFILYGKRGLLALEVKRGRKIHAEDIKGLKVFRGDYPMSKTCLLYGGDQKMYRDGIIIYPLQDFLRQSKEIMENLDYLK